MKLYYMPGACSLATHIVMRESGQKVELEKVGRDKKTESCANFLEISPKGYVPALRLDDGDILTENVVVHNYLADLKPESKLAPAPGTKARLKQDELALYITTEIHKTYSPLFNPATPDEVKKGQKDKLAQRYDLIEKLLSDGRPYLTGQNFATVDSYLFTVTRWGAAVGLDLSAFPRLLEFQKRVAARPAVHAALEAEGLLKAA